VHRSLAIVAAAALTGCGQGTKELSDCPLISGKFSALSTLDQTSGSCARAKSSSVDSLTFSKGNYQFPVGDGLVNCRTDEIGCAITVHCASPLLTTVRMLFEGTLSTDGRHLVGTATFTGNYDGCSLVVYSVDATLQ
jgi:hypothetical protein